MSISNLESEELESDPYSIAHSIALMALGRRAKSKGELLTLLKKRGIEEEIAHAVLFRLQEQGVVNDYEFARYWSESRQRTKKVSRRIIISELRGKGISNEVIDWVTSDITEDDEFSNAMKFAERKVVALRRLENEVAYRRLHGALSRRGFSSSIVLRVLSELGITRS